MKPYSASARYMHHANPSEISVNTFTFSDDDVIVNFALGGTDLSLEVWVVDSNGLIHVVPNATVVRLEARGVAVPTILGYAFANTGYALMAES